MIEMTYKGNAKDNSKEDRQMIPKNIRQIGEAGKERKVYLEDYAVTYLQQVSMAILLGEIREGGNVQYVFVNGAVQADSSDLKEEDWEGLYREVREHFADREIIGYYRKMDEEPTEISGEIEELFRSRFSGEGNILILHDLPEDENVVFLMENGLLKKQSGYYIYYEKNQAMQDYMVDHGEERSVEKEGEVSDKAIQNFRKIIGEKNEEKEQEKEPQTRVKTPRFLYAASTFMVLVIAVIGVTIMNSNDKMNRVESTLADLAKQTESVSETETIAEAENQEELTGETQITSTSDQETEISQTEADVLDNRENSFGQQQTQAQETTVMEESESQTESAVANSGAVSYQSSYTVKAGDTLANICRMYYGSIDRLEEICQLNGIQDPNTIIMGQKIALP